MDKLKVMEKAIDTFGEGMQKIVAMEELAELQQALSKDLRGKEHNVEEEIADATIMLMQYTGLKDKKGKEIYEGDVLLYNNDIKSIVHYKNGAFVRSYENSNIYLLYDSFITDGCLDDYEVIGNIYEDKHLLEEV
ncbi:YopX family protein [Clostridium tertium]